MVNDIKALLIQQLRAAYGPGVHIYDEPVKQGLKTPAFIVLIIHDSQTRKLHRLAEWEYLVNVTFFPSDPNEFYTEADEVSQTFKMDFRYIGNLFHVHKLEAVKQDGALVITFTVKKLVREIVTETKMNHLTFGGVTSE
ncbi:phage tail terminator family protein [Sporosarcina trichiuri]|uniref:phage tail terminator family protein n=1 Tax=Sporosarcina trichiuri TaxID=3056445 RepID=UPI0025B62190|nr:hypothetical protein [Sporosarcina sp. 0.2-SM1T-5]WJY27474.1 hypothetical protein QWT68_00185 [Sporosarcina sp. 0.2-SM1T-5]